MRAAARVPMREHASTCDRCFRRPPHVSTIEAAAPVPVPADAYLTQPHNRNCGRRSTAFIYSTLREAIRVIFVWTTLRSGRRRFSEAGESPAHFDFSLYKEILRRESEYIKMVCSCSGAFAASRCILRKLFLQFGDLYLRACAFGLVPTYAHVYIKMYRINE